jgi:hypothetical protein
MIGFKAVRCLSELKTNHNLKRKSTPMNPPIENSFVISASDFPDWDSE